MTEYRWSTHAYAKVAFHCAKYLTNPLSGVLLGAEKDGHVNIIDAIPLFHTPVMAPMMEVALLQVRHATTCKTRHKIQNEAHNLASTDPPSL